jgi:uncharacterized membrane protein YbhN (UPF0104 family)
MTMFPFRSERVGGGQGRIWLLSLLVSLAMCAVLVRVVDWGAFLEALRRANYGLLIVVAGLTVGTLFCRAQRLRLLLESHGGAASHAAYLRATALHHLFFVALPSGVGDASLPFIVRTHLQQPYGAAVASLVFSRLQDLIVVLAFGIAAGLAMVVPGQMAVLGGCVLLISVVAALYRTTDVVEFFGRRARFLVDKLRSRQDRAEPGTALAGSRAMSPRTRIQVAAWTVVSWVSAATALWFAFRTYGHALTLADLGLIVFGLNVIGAAAIFTIAGLGMTETGLLGLLLVLSWSFAEAASVAVAVRLSLLTINLAVPAAIEGVNLLAGLGKSRARPIA